ncbi:MAG: phospho-N-acetylmuramoyl-pentapeptide-transferase [Puniceicoccaceae bacterium]|nr:MAG: phospho-N-acetylmuramoyl-pentapeptide-transferase [Puniceicoccaceae bacterium]
MLSWLAEYEAVFGPLRLLRFITFRTLAAAGTALLIGFIIGPWLIATLRRFSLQQSLRGKEEVGRLAELHEGKKNTPTMGGLIIFCGIMISALLWARPNIYVGVALAVYASLTVLGFLDDWLKVSRRNSRGLSSRRKLAWQTLTAAAALALLLWHPESAAKMREIWIPFLKDPVLTAAPIALVFGLFFLVLVGSSNAINLTDGVDGLAIGCTISVGLVYAIMAYASGHAIIADYLLISNVPGTGELTVVCGAMVGAGMAFLWFNSHPAEVFMGDTGSLALGGMIGAVAFMVHQPLTLVVVGGIFVLEALSVILQVGSYRLRGKRIFRMAPLHHHFELAGWAETKVVIRFWILSLLFALAGLGTLKLR